MPANQDTRTIWTVLIEVLAKCLGRCLVQGRLITSPLCTSSTQKPQARLWGWRLPTNPENVRGIWGKIGESKRPLGKNPTWLTSHPSRNQQLPPFSSRHRRRSGSCNWICDIKGARFQALERMPQQHHPRIGTEQDVLRPQLQALGP